MVRFTIFAAILLLSQQAHSENEKDECVYDLMKCPLDVSVTLHSSTILESKRGYIT